MSYSREVYEQAMAELSRRRREAEGQAAALRERVCRTYPRAAELERRMAASASEVAQVVLGGGDPAAAVKQIEKDNLAAQAELRRILKDAGEAADNFAPRYTCPHCQDTGYVGTRKCDCLSALLSELAGRQLSRLTGMRLAGFDEMDLGYYSAAPNGRGESPREHMADVLEYCRCYGENFHAEAESLLLFGPTGTGKTHVALSIARMVAEKGFSVVYGPVQKLLHQVEKEHFGRSEGDSEDTMIDCDLLILDDLGTELTGAFYTATLYNIINGRLLGGRPTIISTNLTPPEWDSRYGEQIASRVLGTYQPLLFMGNDIRQAKLERNMQGR